MGWAKNFLREVASSAAGSYVALWTGLLFGKLTGMVSGVNWVQVTVAAIPLVAGILVVISEGFHLFSSLDELRNVLREQREKRQKS